MVLSMIILSLNPGSSAITICVPFFFYNDVLFCVYDLNTRLCHAHFSVDPTNQAEKLLQLPFFTFDFNEVVDCNFISPFLS